MHVAARFFVHSITKRANADGAQVELQPVTGGRRPGNADWAKWTPSGRIELYVTAGPAATWFEEHLGRDVAITFASAPEPPVEDPAASSLPAIV